MTEKPLPGREAIDPSDRFPEIERSSVSNAISRLRRSALAIAGVISDSVCGGLADLRQTAAALEVRHADYFGR